MQAQHHYKESQAGEFRAMVIQEWGQRHNCEVEKVNLLPILDEDQAYLTGQIREFDEVMDYLSDHDRRLRRSAADLTVFHTAAEGNKAANRDSFAIRGLIEGRGLRHFRALNSAPLHYLREQGYTVPSDVEYTEYAQQKEAEWDRLTELYPDPDPIYVKR